LKEDNLTYGQQPETSGLEINETLDGRKITDKERSQRIGKEKSPQGDIAPKRRGDRWIWGIYIVLVIVSIIEPYSASSREVHADNIYGPLIGQVKFLIAGFVMLYLTQKVHYKFFRKTAWLWGLISLVLLILSMVIGESVNGATRAIPLPGFGSLQPAEIVKLTVVIWLAAILSRFQIRKGVATQGCVYCALIVLVFGGLLYPNGLTNMLLMMLVSVTMFLIGGMEMKKFSIIILVYAVMGGAIIYVKNSEDQSTEAQTEQMAQATDYSGGKTEAMTDRSTTQVNRIKRFMEGVHPGDTINDKNRQVIFANFAMARGGLLGAGPGTSQESARLPLAFSDYIYSIIVEDAGWVGGILLMLVYITLAFRAGVVAYNCSRTFPALLIMGCAVMIVFQAMVHMAIVSGVFPVSGQPLPLISRGGTSIIIMSIAFGMMLSVSKFAVQKGNKKEVKAEQDVLPESIHAINPTQQDNLE